MDTQVEPFLRLEPEVAPRLEPLPAVLSMPAPPARRVQLPSTLLGAGVLALGLPALRLTVVSDQSAAVYGVAALVISYSAYVSEVYRAGINAVHRSQVAAARSLGLSQWASMRYVILPQAFRNVLPDLISNTLEVVKLTSIASVVALPEMLYSADMARSLTYNASPIVLAAGIYLVLLWPVVRLVSRMEHRVAH